MRTQLQLGYRIAALTQRGTSPDEIRKRFPNVWPKMLERKKTIAQKKGEDFFKKGLKNLFETELLSKDSVSSYSALMERFQAKMIR